MNVVYFFPMIISYTLKNCSLMEVRNIFLFFLCFFFFFRICEAAKIHGLLEQELAHAVNACSHALNKANPRFPEVKEEQKFPLSFYYF